MSNHLPLLLQLLELIPQLARGKGLAGLRRPSPRYPWHDNDLSAVLLRTAFGPSATADMIDAVRRMSADMATASMIEAGNALAAHDVRQVLPFVDMPTTVVVGDADRITPKSEANIPYGVSLALRFELGDLLARAREIVGPDVLIAAELDPHSHLTPKRVAAADILASFLEFPHTDFYERGEHVVDLALRALRGDINHDSRGIALGVAYYFDNRSSLIDRDRLLRF